MKTIPTDIPAATLEQKGFDEKSNVEFVDLKDGTLYALCVLELHGDVTPDDYAALGAAIKAITGIQDVTLVIDHKTQAVVQENHTQVCRVRANIELDDRTPKPE